MPTAAKAVAALAFALVAYFAAQGVKAPGVMPEGTQFGWFSEITAGIGFLCGWIVMGGLVGRGYGEAAASGLRVSVTILFWALLGFAIYDMVLLSTKLRYDGPMEAVLDVFNIMMVNGRRILTVEILGILAVGGVLAGCAAEWAGKRWK
jgi:hypothetical protein